MSALHLSHSLFLESQELRRFQQFLTQDGQVRQLLAQTARFGLVGDAGNFRLSLDDAAGLTLKVSGGLAFDAQGRSIRQQPQGGIIMPVAYTWYWVKVRYAESTLEEGTVSVSADGSVQGEGTRFLEVLRGQPNFPSRIRLYRSAGVPAVLNGATDHEVQEVGSHTSAVLSTVGLQNEAGLRYAVVGTFDAGFVPAPADKEIYRYDSCRLTLVPETQPGQAPALEAGETPNDTFFVARVQRDNTQVYVEDKRTQFWQTRSDEAGSFVELRDNPLFGVEAIKWDGASAARDRNLVYVGWALRSADYAFDAGALQITLNNGQGGRYLSTSQVAAGDLDGWRLYLEGQDRYCRILSSTKPTPTTVRLSLAGADPLLFLPLAEGLRGLIIAPDAEGVDVKAVPLKAAGTQALGPEVFHFPSYLGEGRLALLVDGDTQEYRLHYRYRNGYSYTAWRPLPDGPAPGGYFAEAMHTPDGEVRQAPLPQRTAYAGGKVRLVRAVDSIYNFRLKVDTGDRRGIIHTGIVAADPVRVLTVGTDYQYQLFDAAEVALTANAVIDLSTEGAKNGNAFMLHFRQKIVPAGFTLSINQGYQNPGQVGTVLRQFSALEIAAFTVGQGVLLQFVYDGNGWVHYVDSVSAQLTVASTRGTVKVTRDGASLDLAVDSPDISNTDLNNLLDDGTFFGANLGSRPSAAAAFLWMYVQVIVLDPSETNRYVRQIAWTFQGNAMYIRECFSGAWSAWERVVTQAMLNDHVQQISQALALRDQAIAARALNTEEDWKEFFPGSKSVYRKDNAGFVHVLYNIFTDEEYVNVAYVLPAGYRPGGDGSPVVNAALDWFYKAADGVQGYRESTLVPIRALADGTIQLLDAPWGGSGVGTERWTDLNISAHFSFKAVG